VILFKIEYSC